MTNKEEVEKTVKQQTQTSQPTRKLFLKLFIPSLLILCIAIFVVLAFDSSILSSANIFNYLKRDLTTKEENKMAQNVDTDVWKNAKSIYEFQVKDIDGNAVDMSKYKNRVVLIVNVACMCGFTGSNYPQLEELHEKYSAKGLSVLAFPCNQFGSQEPLPEPEIKEFVQKFNVQFDMFSKVNVNGDSAHPLYKYLKSKVDGTFGSFIKWNFSKFLVNKEGIPVKRYAPTTAPKDIEDDIVKLLEGKSSL